MKYRWSARSVLAAVTVALILAVAFPAYSDTRATTTASPRQQERPEPASFDQRDEEWAEDRYADGTFGSYGCGPSALANVLKGLGRDVDPGSAGEWAVEKGYDSTSYSDAKTDHRFFIEYASENDVAVTQTDSRFRALLAVFRGDWVIVQMIVPEGQDSGRWTRHSHYVTWYGLSGGDALIRDSAGKKESKVRAPVRVFVAEAKTYFIVSVGRRGSTP